MAKKTKDVLTIRERKLHSGQIILKKVEYNINGDWASGYWGVGGYGGLLKRVKRSLMTFPDAQ